jgi:hypothetical protein
MTYDLVNSDPGLEENVERLIQLIGSQAPLHNLICNGKKYIIKQLKSCTDSFPLKKTPLKNYGL